MNKPLFATQSKFNLFYKFLLFLLIFNIGFCSFSQSKTKAFPTAEGFGKYATGGRGGKVIKVTNLNDSGRGSLREALMYAKGARTVVFEVGGTINLKSFITIKDGNVTVAGQTAPGGGILIRGSMLMIESSNVIIRYLRFRPGAYQYDAQDGVTITAWDRSTVENVIIDHCSISWAHDENLNIRAPTRGLVKNVTIQNSIISESGYGVLVTKGTQNITFYNNLFAHNKERNIRSNNPNDGPIHFEMINNIIYGFRYATGVSLGSRITVENNYYKKSKETVINGTAIEANVMGEGNIRNTYAYVSGNLVPSGFQEYNKVISPYLKSTPIVSSGIPAIKASDVPGRILSHVGASLPLRDDVDTRIISQFNKGTGSLVSSGKYPGIAGGKASVDSDNDGMPDAWEIKNGLNPNSDKDRNDIQSGYTNLENFLNGIDIKNTATSTTIVVSPNKTDLPLSKTLQLTKTLKPQNSSNEKGVWSSSNEKVAKVNANGVVTPISVGKVDIKFKSAQAGLEGKSVINVVQQAQNISAGKDQSVCEGNTVTLTANGGSTFRWNTGAKTQSIEVSPNQTTKYSVTGYDNKGKSLGSDDVIVTVNALAKVNAGNDITINVGEKVTLRATGAKYFMWSTGDKKSTTTVSPRTTTTYTVRGKNSDECEGTDSVKVIVRNTSPAKGKVNANAGKNQSICAGSSATLTATGGASYVWSTGEKTARIKVAPSSTTTYSVRVYDSSGRNADTATVTVVVNPLANVDAGKDITINAGEKVTLRATGARYFMWSTGDKQATTTVSPRTTTTYSVRGKNSDECEGTDSVKVIVRNTSAEKGSVQANAGKNQSICAGSSATLTATGGASYVWSTGEKTATIKVAPRSTTTYSVRVYDSSGRNADTATVTVVVNPLANVDAGKDITINAGEKVTLRATGARYFMWSTGDKKATTTVSPRTTTTYTVRGKNSDECEATDSVKVIVRNTSAEKSSVNAYAGQNQTICAGSSTILTATGGASYVWNTGERTANIKVAPRSTTTYSVRVYDSSGRNADTATVTVVVNPLANVDAGKDITINAGEKVTLRATGARYFMWSTGDKKATTTVSPRTTTTYSVRGKNSDECEGTDTVRVIVRNTSPTASRSFGATEKSNVENKEKKVVNLIEREVFLPNNESIVLTPENSTDNRYLWSTGETTHSISVSPTETSEYSVMIDDGLTLKQQKIIVHNIKFENEREITQESFNNVEFSVYPNPTYGEVKIKISGMKGLSSINFYDLSGKLLFQEPIDNTADGIYTKELNLSDYEAGLYILQLTTNHNVITKKIILK